MRKDFGAGLPILFRASSAKRNIYQFSVGILLIKKPLI
jgi:hypothetical protein